MKLTPPSCLLALLIVGSALPSKAPAETLTIACGAVGIEYRLCREGAEAWGRGNTMPYRSSSWRALDSVVSGSGFTASKRP